MSRDWLLFAADMLDFCRGIEAFSEGLDFKTFAESPKERDALVHGYFAISDSILWDLVTAAVPALSAHLVRLVEQHPAD